MKPLRKLLEKIEPNFQEGGKLHKFWPVYDGFATFLFVPGHTTQKGTHIRDGMDLKRTMIIVVTAMIPALLFGMYNSGYQHFKALGIEDKMSFLQTFMNGFWKVLPIVIVSYVVGLGVEFLFCIIKKHQINEGFLVTGMLIPLCLPIDIPLWMVAVATVFSVVIGKEVFGGTGMNILNIALTARAFLFFAYPTYMSGDKVWVNTKPVGEVTQVVDGYSGATSLGIAASTVDMNKQIYKLEEKITYEKSKGNTADQKKIQKLEQDIKDKKKDIARTMERVTPFKEASIGLMKGSIGETSTLAILIGAIILIASGIGSWRIILSVFIGGYAMGWIFNLLSLNPFMTDIAAHHHLVLGGFAFGAVFMATDPVTASQTNIGKYIYGFLIGFLGVAIRVFNPAYPEGIMLAILFMNVMAPLIDHYVIQGNIKRREKRLKTVSYA